MSGLLILGAGGHGKVVADIAITTRKWDNIAFLDNNKNLTTVLGFPVLGDFDSYENYKEIYSAAFVAIGNNKARMQWIRKLKQDKYDIPVILHPSSIISRFSEVGLGSVVMAGTVINAGVNIGQGCIINTGSTIDHDCEIEEGVHISPGVNLSGTVRIKSLSWLGVGTKISNNISIGTNVIVAAGATVINDIPDNVMVAGIPAKIKKRLGDE